MFVFSSLLTCGAGPHTDSLQYLFGPLSQFRMAGTVELFIQSQAVEIARCFQ